MEKEEKEISLSSAVKVADRVDLRSVRLLACSCRQSARCPSGKKPFDIEKTSRFTVDKEKNLVGVFIRFLLNGFAEEVVRTKNNSFLNIEAEFVLLYGISSLEGLEDAALRSFAEVNGTYNAWPYWREFVQSIASRMELPPLTIPVFRILSPPSKTAKAKRKVPAKS